MATTIFDAWVECPYCGNMYRGFHRCYAEVLAEARKPKPCEIPVPLPVELVNELAFTVSVEGGMSEELEGELMRYGEKIDKLLWMLEKRFKFQNV